MLDENLPTYHFKQSSENPLSSVLYFTHNGNEREAYYSLHKQDPALPEAKNRYSVTLHDASWQDIIFAGVTIEPHFTQPTLSAAEIRAQNGVPPAPVPLTPEKFTIELNQPPQDIVVTEKKTWTGKESFEFEIPTFSFLEPSASKIDRGKQKRAADAAAAPVITFKWKRESKFSKDMTCYMTGSSVGGNKSKEPDITVALYKHGRDQAVTIYDPNLQRVPVQDKRGLEVVLLMSAEVIREIYLAPGPDVFNLNGTLPNKRKNSKPLPIVGSAPIQRPDPYAMTGAGPAPTTQGVGSPIAQQSVGRPDPEVQRLQAIAEQQEKEREKRDKAEQKRIKKMLEEEEKEQKRRDAEVAKETERLRREFGMDGQDYRPPTLPPRSNPNTQHHQPGPSRPTLHVQTPAQPPRPSSTGPHQQRPGHVGWFAGPGMASTTSFFGSNPTGQQRPGRRRGGSGDGKIHKKKSTFF